MLTAISGTVTAPIDSPIGVWTRPSCSSDTPAWASEAAFATHDERVRHIDTLHEKIGAWTAELDDRALAARLQEHGVAGTPVLNVADLLHDPHWRARGTFVEVEHPLGFKETIYGSYVKLSRSAVAVEPGPVMGRDNEHVFKTLLGLDDARYQALVEAQVIY